MPASGKRNQRQQQQSQQQSTNDLRSHATDLKRDIEFKHKWSPAWALPGVPTVKSGPNDTKRPLGRPSKQSTAHMRRLTEKIDRKTKAGRKQDGLSTASTRRGCTTIESSTDDDDLSSETSDTPEPEVFDVEAVGRAGEEILELAMNKAVERYDHQTLIKLVKDEYEVLDGVDEEGHGVKVASGDFDDEFELV